MTVSRRHTGPSHRGTGRAAESLMLLVTAATTLAFAAILVLVVLQSSR
jgi:hypothetical protein